MTSSIAQPLYQRCYYTAQPLTYIVYFYRIATNIPWLCTFCHKKELTSYKKKWSLSNFYSFYFPEFFASLLGAGRVSHTDSKQTTLEAGNIFQAGPSSYSSSPSTSGFDPNRHDQPNGAGTKKVSKQLANKRRRTRKHKKKWDFFLWLHWTKPKRTF